MLGICAILRMKFSSQYHKNIHELKINKISLYEKSSVLTEY